MRFFRSRSAGWADPRPEKGERELFVAERCEQTFPAVNDEQECGDELAWYYDDLSDPSRVFLCAAACELALSDPEAPLEVLFGCATEVLPTSLAR
jgi:hypothetical protein